MNTTGLESYPTRLSSRQRGADELHEELGVADAGGFQAAGEAVVGVDRGIRVHLEDERLFAAHAEVDTRIIAATRDAIGLPSQLPEVLVQARRQLGGVARRRQHVVFGAGVPFARV